MTISNTLVVKLKQFGFALPLLICSCVAQSAEFIPLGMLPGADQSSAFGISPNGRYVVGSSGGESFRWSRDDGMIWVSQYNTADDVSADGSVVVGGDGQAVAYRWDNGSLSIIGDLTTIGRTEDSPGGSHMSSGHGISADGSVIVGNTSVDANGESDSFRIIDGQIELIGDFPEGPYRTGIRSVSADGRIAVGYGYTDLGQEALRWEDGTRESLGDLEGGDFFSWAVHISADGQAIVGRSSSSTGTEAFRWTRETGMVGLGHLPGGNDSRAWDVSGDGSVVVGVHDNQGARELRRTWIWDETHGMRDLQQMLIDDYGLTESLTGWNLIQARAISDDAFTIAGAAINPDGLIEAYVVDLNPVPVLGDFNGDSLLTDVDIELLTAQVMAGRHPSDFDLNGDFLVDQYDRVVWVHELENTFFGDANLDGEFNSGDLVTIFEAGEYEDDIEGNSTWATGDWNGDGDFNTSDLVVAFEDGGYEQGPRAAVLNVPEPASSLSVLIALLLLRR